MTLRSKLIGILTFLIIFPFTFASLNCSQAFAQDKNVKPAVQTASVFKPLVTFIEIGAARCIPCKAMQPIMKEIAEEYRGQVEVLFFDVWTPQGKMDAEKYNIRVIPTQVFLDKDGKEYFRHEGYFPKEDLVRVLKMQGIK